MTEPALQTVPVADDPRTIAEVGLLLSRGGLPAGAEEVAVLAAGYEQQQQAIEGLYAVAEARYADPALRFRADARLSDWSETPDGAAG